MNLKPINDLSHELIGAAIEVHREVGLGLLESAYERACAQELTLRNNPHVRQKLMAEHDQGISIETGYRIEVIAGERVNIELKSVEKLRPIYRAQLLTSLRLTRLSLGLLINFSVHKLIDGIDRVSNNPANLSASCANLALNYS